MKKRGIILSLLVISVLLISIINSINLVSAGLFGDAWNKITGKVVDNETGEEVEEVTPESECSSLAKSMWCPDEKTLCPEKTDEQGCSVWDCDSCETTPEPPPEDKECEEGKIKYYTCEDGTKIPECECENEKWICKISPESDCPEVGPEPETCAAEIKVTFNKDVYNIGDDVKIIIEIFDSQGNHLPNYAFYGEMYDDRWHTPDLQKTDNKGYFILTTTAQKPAGGVTEVKFKVYTKEKGSCGSVEDIKEVKIELGECGIGSCAPEPECKNKVKMCGGECPPCPGEDDGGIFYPCAGCELEEKCYPYGFRKAGNYCSDAKDNFVSQLEDNEICENNFECKTNLCINGNCVSSNVWNKFLEWFRNIFGGGEDEEIKDCSKVLIEEDIGDYEYVESAYGPDKDTQAPLFSNDCEQIGTIKCCVAKYSENEDSSIGGIICPYNNRADVEKLVKCALVVNAGDFLGEYKDEKVMKMNKERVIVWTHESYVIGVGKNPLELGIPEDIADAYLNKYPNDLGEIDIGDVPPPVEPKSCEEYDGEERNECYVKLAISESDVEICENIVYDIDHRDKCYINVAEHTGDDSICDEVTDTDLKEKCYFWVAGETGESGACEEITDVDLQSICYVELAEKQSDATYCEKIIDVHIIGKCYREVGIQTNDVSLCEKITDPQEPSLNPKDECYAGIGIQTNDRSLCEKIIWEQAKQKCLENTS